MEVRDFGESDPGSTASSLSKDNFYTNQRFVCTHGTKAAEKTLRYTLQLQNGKDISMTPSLRRKDLKI